MNDIANRIITEILNYIKSQLPELFQSFFSDVVSVAEDEIQKNKALKKATEEVVDKCVTERLKEATERFHEEFGKVELFTEDEIRGMFDKYYNEYREQNSSVLDTEISSEELYKRFMIYVDSYVENFVNKMSFSEKMILERTNQINTRLNGILYKEDFEKISKENTQLLKDLLNRNNKPLLAISDTQDIKINPFEAKYVFWNNTFDFGDEDRENCYIISLSLTNISDCLIENLEISDFELIYCKETDEDEEFAYSILPASFHAQNEFNTMNIMPESNQKIHLIIKKDELEANNYDEYKCEEFLQGGLPFEFDNMELKFKMKCKCESETSTYEVIIFISKISSIDTDDITGVWEINFVSMNIIDK